MARQYRTDPKGFHRQSEAGRVFFHGPGEPEDSGPSPRSDTKVG
jgi:hypothetical protein